MAVKRWALPCGAVSLLTMASLAVHARELTEKVSVLPDGAVWALGMAALWLLYRAWLRLDRPFGPKRLWVLAALFAGVMTLGQSFSAYGTAEWVTARRGEALLFAAGRIPLYAAAMRLLVHALGRLPARTDARRLTGWQLGGLLWLCWLPWYVCLFPGTVSVDSISMLMITYGLEPLTNANPFCQTALLWLFRKAGELVGSPDAGIALYCIIQSVLMAWLMGELVSEMRQTRAPEALCRGSFAFYALCPIFPVFAFCVGKDTNFAMAVLFLALETWRVSHGRPVRPARYVCLSVAAVGCVLLRNPGVYLAALTLALLLIFTSVRRSGGRWRVPLCGLLCAGLSFALLHAVVLPGLNVAPMPKTEEYSLPLQQVARVAAGEALTPGQREAVNGVLELDRLHTEYNGELSDPVKNLWREDCTPEQQAAFWKAWPQIVKDNPMTCLSATFHNTYGYLYPGYVSTIKPTLIVGDHSGRTANVWGYFDYSVNPLSAKVKAFTDRLNLNSLYRLLVSPGLYGWITLFAAVWLAGRRGWRELLSAVPALFTLAGCLLSAVNGYFRYAMPLYASAPLLLWLVAQSVRKA
ncbi:MAG: DUF6020 family protein [Clostridia bacterium]|nr:DUF6020 family protein [Clostridia bacterium]MDD6040730.1 DUF6020 family protein [Clostridia bacterium]